MQFRDTPKPINTGKDIKGKIMKPTKSIEELKQMNLADIETLIHLNQSDIFVYIGIVKKSGNNFSKGGGKILLTGDLSTKNPANMNGGLQINMEYTDKDGSWAEYYKEATRIEQDFDLN